MSKWSHFADWVNGDYQPKEYVLFTMATKPKREKRSEEEEQHQDQRRLRHFFRFYPIAAAAITLCMVGILLVTALSLPPFGNPDNPTNNDVAEHYIEMSEEETGATNAVTGMILNYRGFDTFGESCVLFLAVNCVIMLLRRDDEGSPVRLRGKRECFEEAPGDLILQQAARLMIPLIFLFGAYVLLNGHASPGGGFSGGTILGGGLILFSAAFGFSALQAYLDYDVYNVVRVLGLGVYALLYAFYIFVGANGLGGHISTEHGGLIAPIEIAVGIVVACTIYGFYALFARGEI
ncbi:hypothetical protein H8790_09660 [Oscillibacter hominis]|uniref:Sodium:proton antiporter n=1 Tax=Oscillibacter hominis TaxID=2763056 RepID=A0A7G9B2F0_9FIRM|nr:hydrogen gas-evolving membrane-bound hydrogenase subunit E [Oscillibacter hominis]QNL43731.1 hypothetical protein H8790_09660 [Oscillibacter hominis]